MLEIVMVRGHTLERLNDFAGRLNYQDVVNFKLL